MAGAYDMTMLGQQTLEGHTGQDSLLFHPDGSGKANDYSPPPLPRSAFPAQERGAPGKDLLVHRDRLAQVATQMASDLARLRAALQRLYAEGAGGALIGGWPAAEAFGNNAGNAYAGISQFYQDLNTAYELVISNLRQTVSNYADAESATVSAVHGVGSGPAGAPLAPGA
jgi:hypothetical protein